VLLSLFMLASPSAFAPAFAFWSPATSDDEEEQSSPKEVTIALDLSQHARRASERPRAADRQHVIHPPRRHHAPAITSLTLPAHFRVAINPPLHC
jgi:hypothetical protein